MEGYSDGPGDGPPDGPRDEPRDVVAFGSDRERRRAPRWLVVALAALAAMLVYAVVGDPGEPADSAGASTPSSSPSSEPSQEPSEEPSHEPAQKPHSSGSSRPSDPVVETVQPLPGAQPGWEIVARGRKDLVRIDPALGRVVRRSMPELDSSGPVSFVVGPDRVLIRPWDAVPGFVVPDDGQPRQLRGNLGHGGSAFPGPEPGQVWTASFDGNGEGLALVDLEDGTTVSSVSLPIQSWVLASDQRGGALFSATGGVYLATVDGVERVTTGAVLAVGPTRWLLLECDDQARCSSVAVNRATGERTVIERSSTNPSSDPGVISPDGTTAARFASDDYAPPTLRLIDLDTGAERMFDLTFDDMVMGGPGGGAMAWSPNSRWLLVAGVPGGGVRAIDTRTGRVRTLGGGLPRVSQVAVRTKGE